MDRSSDAPPRDQRETSDVTATFQKTASAPHRVCPTCGELLVSSRCPECVPIEPARSYSDRVTQQITGAALAGQTNAVDGRRATGEWVTGPDEREPQTRRAHPTLVRSALAEAEERSRDKVARSALVTRVQTQTKPRQGQTAPRLRPVTPLPPAPHESTEPPEPEVPAAPSVVVAGGFKLDSQPVDPRDLIAKPLSPVAVSPLAAVPQPVSEPRVMQSSFDEVPDTNTPSDEIGDGRAKVFWLAVLVSAVVLLVFAAR